MLFNDRIAVSLLSILQRKTKIIENRRCIVTTGLSEESLKKSLETKKNNLKQIATLEDTETDIVIDYEMKKIRIYTNRATVMNRLERLGYKPTKEDTADGQIYSRSYVFETSEIGNFLRTGIFKFD